VAAITNVYTPAGPGGTSLERESLSNLVERVSLDETPLYSNCRKGTEASIKPEWATETIGSIAAPTNQSHGYSNGNVTAAIAAVRLTNAMQVNKIDGGVSHSMEAVDAAAAVNKMAHQKLLKGIKLRRQMNKAHHGLQITATTDPPAFGTIKTFCPTAQFLGAAATPGTAPTGDGTTLPTQGTTVDTFDTIANINTQLEVARTTEGFPNLIYFSPKMQGLFSRLPDGSIAENRVNMTSGSPKPFQHVGTVNMYLSDFGLLETAIDIDAPNSDILMVDHDYIEILKLPGMDFNDYMLGKLGSGDLFVIENAETVKVTLPTSIVYINGYAT
jgi:hypothetical protein